MPKTKPVEKSTSAKIVKVKVRKISPKTKRELVSQRAAAVEENLGETQSLRDFLSGVGWR